MCYVLRQSFLVVLVGGSPHYVLVIVKVLQTCERSDSGSFCSKLFRAFLRRWFQEECYRVVGAVLLFSDGKTVSASRSFH